jgi:hypothetical protein
MMGVDSLSFVQIVLQDRLMRSGEDEKGFFTVRFEDTGYRVSYVKLREVQIRK